MDGEEGKWTKVGREVVLKNKRKALRETKEKDRQTHAGER